MLSHCANPGCSETFRYLYEGKIFYLAPTPDVQIALGMQCESLHERFWLCERCSKEMTVTWDGTKANVARLPARPAVLALSSARKNLMERMRARSRAAAAGRADR